MAPIFFSLSLSLPSALRSSALHYMQLLPHRTWMNHGNVSFEANLQQKLMIIRGSTECPIFHTINYICDKKYEGKYAEVIRDPAKFEVQNKQACSEYVRKKGIHQNPASVAEMCWQFRFTAAGSENLAIKERRVMETATPPLRRIVDRFNTTRGQCWATDKGDGRHYLPLMPYALKSVLSFATECRDEGHQHSRQGT